MLIHEGGAWTVDGVAGSREQRGMDGSDRGIRVLSPRRKIFEVEMVARASHLRSKILIRNNDQSWALRLT